VVCYSYRGYRGPTQVRREGVVMVGGSQLGHLDPRQLRAGGPQNDGPWKRWTKRLKKMAMFGICLDFWGVQYSHGVKFLEV